MNRSWLPHFNAWMHAKCPWIGKDTIRRNIDPDYLKAYKAAYRAGWRAVWREALKPTKLSTEFYDALAEVIKRQP